MSAMVAITASRHSHHSGMVMQKATLILVFPFVTLRAILQSCRRLKRRPRFIAGQSGHVALIGSDIGLFARSHGWTGLVSGQAWNTGAAVWRCGGLR